MLIRKSVIAAAVAVLALAGCGSSSHPGEKKPLPRIAPSPTQQVLKAKPCDHLGPPCSSITPEGAPKSETHVTTGPEDVTGPTGTTGTSTTSAVAIEPAAFLAPDSELAFVGSQIHINTAGIEFISHFENNFQRVYCPYWDPYGRVWSRAYGETDFHGNFGGRCITHAQAVFNLGYMVEHQYLWAVRGLNTNFTQNQVNALASFVWNLGPGSMQWQPLRSELQHHNPYGLLGYDIAGGQVLSALVSRRHAEVALFLKPESRPSRAQLEASIRAHNRTLVRLRARKAALVHALVTSHCKPRSRNRTCKRWVSEAYKVHVEGLHQDHIVAGLKRRVARHEYS